MPSTDASLRGRRTSVVHRAQRAQHRLYVSKNAKPSRCGAQIPERPLFVVIPRTCLSPWHLDRCTMPAAGCSCMHVQRESPHCLSYISFFHISPGYSTSIDQRAQSNQRKPSRLQFETRRVKGDCDSRGRDVLLELELENSRGLLLVVLLVGRGRHRSSRIHHFTSTFTTSKRGPKPIESREPTEQVCAASGSKGFLAVDLSLGISSERLHHPSTTLIPSALTARYL